MQPGILKNLMATAPQDTPVKKSLTRQSSDQGDQVIQKVRIFILKFQFLMITQKAVSWSATIASILKSNLLMTHLIIVTCQPCSR